MLDLDRYFTFGISVGVLFPEAAESPQQHLKAFVQTAQYPGYKALETTLPDDDAIRALEIAIARDEGKIINYNFPPDLQLAGKLDPASEDPTFRKAALDFAKRHVDYAAQAGSKVIGMTTGIDEGEAIREKKLEYFTTYMEELAVYSRKVGIELTLEPVERGKFKNLLLGPTPEICTFVRHMHALGHPNVSVLFDTAHMPLMEEDQIESLKIAHACGIGHIHVGNAIISNPKNPLFGHCHPPLGIAEGEYDWMELAQFLDELVTLGYLGTAPTEDKKCLSYEMTRYPGVSPATSVQAAYEKVQAAWASVLAKHA